MIRPDSRQVKIPGQNPTKGTYSLISPIHTEIYCSSIQLTALEAAGPLDEETKPFSHGTFFMENDLFEKRTPRGCSYGTVA
jgi:hypothetical protein